MTLAYLYWNPDSTLFTLPYFNHPVKWYGLCFMAGFLIGYYLILKPLKNHTNHPQKLADRLLWFVLLGTIIGARLGHVFFYEPAAYLKSPLSILKIWEGGLASHGGTVGVILALLAFRFSSKKEAPNLTFLRICDLVAVPTALVAFFIRLGNFFNQEILGTQTDIPWAVIFGAPFDGSLVVPRHPSQIYEGLAYLALFFFLWVMQKRNPPAGRMTGIFFIWVFFARFVIEYTKEVQVAIVDQSFLQMGQWLSIPFILLGLLMVLASKQLKAVDI